MGPSASREPSRDLPEDGSREGLDAEDADQRLAQEGEAFGLDPDLAVFVGRDELEEPEDGERAG